MCDKLLWDTLHRYPLAPPAERELMLSLPSFTLRKTCCAGTYGADAYFNYTNSSIGKLCRLMFVITESYVCWRLVGQHLCCPPRSPRVGTLAIVYQLACIHSAEQNSTGAQFATHSDFNHGYLPLSCTLLSWQQQTANKHDTNANIIVTSTASGSVTHHLIGSRQPFPAKYKRNSCLSCVLSKAGLKQTHFYVFACLK